MAGIYIHIPFCRQACHYCDFHFSVNLRSREAMVDALCRELNLRKHYAGGERIETIYFGGGTPSVLSGTELQRMLDTIRQEFDVAHDAEVTLEANPDDLSPEATDALHAIGINRLSIGVQSFDDRVLQSLNRIHNGEAARESIERAKAKGFSNISIDLIYAIPGQDNARWEENIREALRLEPQHISSYTLTVEEKTILGKWTRQGKFHAVSDDDAADQHDRLVDMLTDAGFEHYEVSNFARPGFRSQHNTSYWLGHQYLGIGPGAHSFDTRTRQYNVRDNRKYIERLSRDEIPATVEVLTDRDRFNEYLLISLRTSWGIDMNRLRHEFGVTFTRSQGSYIEKLVNGALATVTGDSLVLTRKGLLLADEIALNLIGEGSQLSG